MGVAPLGFIQYGLPEGPVTGYRQDNQDEAKRREYQRYLDPSRFYSITKERNYLVTSHEVESYANARLRYFTLNGKIPSGWSFQWGRGRRQLGCCRYKNKEILVSMYYVQIASDEDIKDTINHEIAHIIAGPTAGHGLNWKRACSLTGAKPERCAKDVDMPSKYVGTCLSCGYKYKANKILKEMNRRVCGKTVCRKPGLYIQWKINREVMVS